MIIYFYKFYFYFFILLVFSVQIMWYSKMSCMLVCKSLFIVPFIFYSYNYVFCLHHLHQISIWYLTFQCCIYLVLLLFLEWKLMMWLTTKLVVNLTLFLHVWVIWVVIEWRPNRWKLKWELRWTYGIEFMIFCSDIILNY